LGLDPRELATLKDDEAVLAMRGEGTRKISRLNYLTDERLLKLSDPNPYHELPKAKPDTTWKDKLDRAKREFEAIIHEASAMGLEDRVIFDAFIQSISRMVRKKDR